MRFIGFVAVTIVVVARSATAQTAVINVRVTDSARAPLRDADLAVVKNAAEPVLIARTDATGRYTFRFEPEKATYRLVARQVGYAPLSRALDVRGNDTLTVDLVLGRLPPSLDTVRVEARPLPLAKQPFVGADEIARDTRAVLSLGDVLGKLRPDITYQAYRCVARTDVRGVLVPGRIPQRIRRPTVIHVYVNGKHFPGEWDPWGSIASEDIDEVRYVNCNDKSIPGLPARAWPSLYVVLKPGFDWDAKRGSYRVTPND